MKTLAILAIAIVLSACSQTTSPPVAANPPPNAEDMTVCTMEAKICPDGSSVARTGPKCEFAACTPTTPSPKTSPVETAPPAETHHVCTHDAQQCPDGSWVGRTGAKCEFICPNKK